MNAEIPPPLSWTKTVTSLVTYWSHVGVPHRRIAAWQANVHGIDVEAMARWHLSQRDPPSAVRAERLASFREVLTLDTPAMRPIGMIVEEPRGRVKLVRGAAELRAKTALQEWKDEMFARHRRAAER